MHQRNCSNMKKCFAFAIRKKFVDTSSPSAALPFLITLETLCKSSESSPLTTTSDEHQDCAFYLLSVLEINPRKTKWKWTWDVKRVEWTAKLLLVPRMSWKPPALTIVCFRFCFFAFHKNRWWSKFLVCSVFNYSPTSASSCCVISFYWVHESHTLSSSVSHVFMQTSFEWRGSMILSLADVSTHTCQLLVAQTGSKIDSEKLVFRPRHKMLQK